jgi:ribosomal protein L29
VKQVKASERACERTSEHGVRRDLIGARSEARTPMSTDTNELRELHDDELDTRLREAKEELFNLRFRSLRLRMVKSHERNHRDDRDCW